RQSSPLPARTTALYGGGPVLQLRSKSPMPAPEHYRSQHPGVLQAKLPISKPGDPCEQEADRLAAGVTHSRTPPVPDGSSTQSEQPPVGIQLQQDFSDCSGSHSSY